MDDNVTTTADSTIIYDLTPDVHAQLDLDVNFLSNLPFDLHAARILTIVLNGCARAYATTIWPIDSTFKDMMACEELLTSNQEIRDVLEKAHRSGQYAEIRNWREWQSQRSLSL